MANLYAPIETCVNASSDSGIAPSSSTHEAVPFEATTGVFLSPENVVITLASCLKTFYSRRPSTNVLS